MFGFRTSVKCAAALISAALLTIGGSNLQAQQQRRPSHETNATRKARKERIMQDTYTHRYEAAGGGGYLRFRSGETLQRNNEVTFWLSGTRYFTFNPRLGIVGEIRGAYGNAKVGNTAFNIANPQISQYNFMGGPNYRLVSREKYAISAFAVAGAAIGKFDSGSKGIPSSYLNLWQSDTRPVFSVGANFDWNLYPNFAIRVTPTYVGNLYRLADLVGPPPQVPPADKGSIQNNLGFNVGLVYRFGRIK
jgi:hypothetical protein